MLTHSRKTALESGQAQPKTTKSIFVKDGKWIVELWKAYEEYPYSCPFDSEAEAQEFFDTLDVDGNS